MQFLTAKQSLARKLDINYADIANNGLFSDSDLGDYIQQASNRAWELHPWPFTQGAKTVTTINTAYYDAPSGFEPMSTFATIINNVTFKKLAYEDYVAFFQNNAGAQDYIFAEFAGYLFVNQAAYTVGQVMDVYGKLIAPQFVNATDELPFTSTDTQQDAGNEAIIELAYATALASDKLKRVEESAAAEGRAVTTLENVWRPFDESRSLSVRRNNPLFNVPSFFGTGHPDDKNNIGNFSA